MRYLKIILSFFLIILMLPSCKKNIQFEDILTSSECFSPCWMDIEPGKTTKDEAISQLKSLPKLINADSIITRTYMGEEQIGWDFLVPKVEGWINIKSGSVTSIEIRYITSLAGKSRFWIKNAIDLYGSPKDIFYARESGDTPLTNVYLVNPQNGVAYAYAQSEYEKLIISPEQEVYAVWFFKPKDNSGVILSELNIPSLNDHDFEWSGYTEIELPQP